MTQPVKSSGTLGFLSAPELLRDLHLRKATGQLVVYRGDRVKKVFFKSGFVLYATSSLPSDRLGDVLLARGMISREHFEESVSQVLATGRKQGTVLVQIGALSPKDLFRGLIAQVREIVLSLFTLEDGDWRFFEGLPPQEEIVSLRVDPASLICEGLVRTAADPRWGGHWDPRRLELHPIDAPSFAPEQLDLPDDARRLLSLVERGLPFEELARLLGRPLPETTALAYGLALLGLIESRPLAAAAAAREPVAPAPPADAETLRLRDKVVALATKLQSRTHYQLLGLDPDANGDAVKRAYIQLAKEYHPDRFFRPEFQEVQESVNQIFMRVNEAFTTLSNPATRAEYDRSVLRTTAPAARMAGVDDDSVLARQQFNKGVGLLKAGDVWESIQALRWAVSLAPQNPRYHTTLGVALTRTKKRLHEAEEHCKTAIALDYNTAQYYVNLGLVYKTGHLFDRAKKQFEAALKLDPGHAQALREIRELETPQAQPHKGLMDRFLKK